MKESENPQFSVEVHMKDHNLIANMKFPCQFIAYVRPIHIELCRGFNLAPITEYGVNSLNWSVHWAGYQTFKIYNHNINFVVLVMPFHFQLNTHRFGSKNVTSVVVTLKCHYHMILEYVSYDSFIKILYFFFVIISIRIRT